MPLHVWDAGTDSGPSYLSPNANTQPPDPIAPVNTTSGPFRGLPGPVGCYRLRLLSSSSVFGCGVNPATSLTTKALPRLGGSALITIDDPFGTFAMPAFTVLALSATAHTAFPCGRLIPRPGAGRAERGWRVVAGAGSGCRPRPDVERCGRAVHCPDPNHATTGSSTCLPSGWGVRRHPGRVDGRRRVVPRQLRPHGTRADRPGVFGIAVRRPGPVLIRSQPDPIWSRSSTPSQNPSDPPAVAVYLDAVGFQTKKGSHLRDSRPCDPWRSPPRRDSCCRAASSQEPNRRMQLA